MLSHSLIYLTKNLPFYSDVRQWSHALMIPLPCLWFKSDSRMWGQFKCDETCDVFVLISFVHMHGTVVP